MTERLLRGFSEYPGASLSFKTQCRKSEVGQLAPFLPGLRVLL
jgi:hypothetical protein